MRLYDEIIRRTLSLLEKGEGRRLYSSGDCPPDKRDWPDGGRAMMILLSDTAYELGGGSLPAVGNTLLTTDASLVPGDAIWLIGKDLGEIRADTPYARIAVVRVREDAIGTGDRLYNAIRNISAFRYHVHPSGFMLRVSSSLERESVRVARKSLEEGLGFTAVGLSMLKTLHMYKEVEEAEIIFITDPGVDYGELKNEVRRTKEITSAIDHMLKDVNMDCASCALEEVCDSVEDLRKMHFGISEQIKK